MFSLREIKDKIYFYVINIHTKRDNLQYIIKLIFVMILISVIRIFLIPRLNISYTVNIEDICILTLVSFKF